ncbi:MAG: NAD(P)/FAD-dependent oxidoreductase [Actinomycetota bacterium]|nr:NAD(P)/FAD-dependent oxidoreductase [Actinomycetota bacterium]
MNENWKCIIVGGGPAGLSAALVLGRARQRVLLVDAGNQSNRVADAIGGLLGQRGVTPEAFYTRGNEEISELDSVEISAATIKSGRTVPDANQSPEDRFRLTDTEGREHRSSHVILATGTEYTPPDIPGLEPLWGSTVFHCPFCHGWEVRDRRLAVLDDSPAALHRALMLANWSDDVILLTNGADEPGGEDRTRLESAGIEIDGRPVASLSSVDGRLTGIEFESGPGLERDAVMAGVTMVPRSELARQLGAEIRTDHPMELVVTGEDQQTTVPGLFAAGDVQTAAPSVAPAIGTGFHAATQVIRQLFDLG